MSDKKDPAIIAVIEYIDQWDSEPDELPSFQIEKAYLAGVRWCRDNEVREAERLAFEAGRETDRCLLTTLVQPRYFDFDDYLKARGK